MIGHVRTVYSRVKWFNTELKLRRYHTGQCKSTGGCYNELVVANFGTGGGVKWRKRLTKSIPVDFMIYL